MCVLKSTHLRLQPHLQWLTELNTVGLSLFINQLNMIKFNTSQSTPCAHYNFLSDEKKGHDVVIKLLKTLLCTVAQTSSVLPRGPSTSQWRHNGHGGVSNHQLHRCLLNRLFRRLKETSKLRVTGLCAGNSPATGEFPAQMASETRKGFFLMTSSCQGHKKTRAFGTRSLQWRHINFMTSVSTHPQLDCLFNSFFIISATKSQKCVLQVICEGNPPTTQ